MTERTRNRTVALLVTGLASVLVVHCGAQLEAVTKPATTPVPITQETEEATPIGELAEKLTLTVVYDNNSYDLGLKTSWGFSCWIQRGETNILFDTGGDGKTLLHNMDALGLDPQSIDVVVLSHIHGDHVGGLGGLLATGVRPMVYVLASFPARFKAQLREQVTVREVDKAQEILPAVYTTGEMGTGVREQGLIIRTSRGLVVITGCAHPSVVEMVCRAKTVVAGKVYLVIGGFHLGSASTAKVKDICAAFRELGVQKLAPCHCTGDHAMRIFSAEFGDSYVQCGVGRAIEVIPQARWPRSSFGSIPQGTAFPFVLFNGAAS